MKITINYYSLHINSIIILDAFRKPLDSVKLMKNEK